MPLEGVGKLKRGSCGLLAEQDLYPANYGSYRRVLVRAGTRPQETGFQGCSGRMGRTAGETSAEGRLPTPYGAPTPRGLGSLAPGDSRPGTAVWHQISSPDPGPTAHEGRLRWERGEDGGSPGSAGLALNPVFHRMGTAREAQAGS